MGLIITKKLYIELANTLSNHRDNMEKEAFIDLVSDIADLCESEDAHFDRQKFLDACNQE